jgi:excisionase family DNA binding protein
LLIKGKTRREGAEVKVEYERREWMKVPEAAQYFGVPRSRMYDLIQRGEVPAVRLGQRSIRVNIGQAERFLWKQRLTGPKESYSFELGE